MAGAFDTIRQSLDEYGLGGLATWAWGRFQDGASLDQIMLEVYDRAEFKAAYPEYETLAKKGRAYSVAELQAYRKAAVGIFRSYGIPQSFYDTPEELANFAANEVSVAELSKRVADAAEAVYSTSPAVRDEMQRLYGVQPGEMIAFWLDPQKAEPMIKQKFTAAQIAGQAISTNYGMLTKQEAELLAGMGVTEQTAQKGFGQLAAMEPLFNPINESEQGITQEVQLGAAFGQDAAALRQVEKRKSERKAEFQSGGGFAMNRQGIVGLGSNQQ